MRLIRVVRVVRRARTPKFEHLSVEQGLSQATVLATHEDHRGSIWAGTQDGLCRRLAGASSLPKL